MNNHHVACALLVSVGLCSSESYGQAYIGLTEIGSANTKLADITNKTNVFVAPHGTVIVGVASAEGLVLAGDSRMTWLTPGVPPGYKILSDFNSKVFDLDNIGVATYGQSFLAGRSISGWMSDFRSQLPKLKPSEMRDVDVVAKSLSDFFSKAYDADFAKVPNGPPLGFVVAGYDAKQFLGKLLGVEFPTSKNPTLAFSTKSAGATWRGETSTISRLIAGYDGRMFTGKTVAALTVEQQSALREDLKLNQLAISFDALMLQDSIDFATSLVRITVEMQRFGYGTIGSPGELPGVGGSVDVLAVLPSGLQWIKRKALTVQ